MQKKLTWLSKQKRKVLVLVFSFFFTSFLFAQQKITVTGNVVTEKNLPLAGVSVNVQGTTSGTTTNAEGRFTIQLIRGATLVLSFVDYQTKQIVVNNESDVANSRKY